MKRHLPLAVLLISLVFAVHPIGIITAPEDERKHIINLTDTSPEESILFLGDVMLGRYVATLIEKHGINYPFEKLRGLLSSTTHTIVNLEGPIPETYLKTPNNGYQFSFPQSATTTLRNANISAVSLANNHTSDHGEEGYAHTVAILKQSGIESFGHSRMTSQTVWKKKVGGIQVVVFGINMISPSWNEVASFNTINRLCTTHKGSYMVAFIHWGEEYRKTHTDIQETYAKKVLETCVDAIIGAHPHVTEGVALYNNKPVFYSLGNAVFDQYFSQETERGLGVHMSFKKDEIQFELLPLISETSRPRISEGEEKRFLLEKISERSEEALQETIKQGFIRIPYPADVNKN
ncbi:MAG: hypothetical protein QG653_268 [Patescibacteria group bacterium]|nr:hypothetical protein [Patescibacteria group bacterium]